MVFSMDYSFLLKLFALALTVCSVHGVDRSKAMGPCVNGNQCPPKLVCVENECYRQSDVSYVMADEAAPSIGSCVNDLCPNGYECVNNQCYKRADGDKMPIGPCINNKCPNGFTCNASDYKCYA
ncbi:hypothetical protein DdX_03201 [Ditylenchus destructor]|uniref:CC domain-containing protein n=1 Tax=Ditylenchus destructor TaxID=166010 RepID=A0AAD4R6P4_9BILA|nr:hypothetical protein DdX_03201 [Ditylenchus destructor]